LEIIKVLLIQNIAEFLGFTYMTSYSWISLSSRIQGVLLLNSWIQPIGQLSVTLLQFQLALPVLTAIKQNSSVS